MKKYRYVSALLLLLVMLCACKEQKESFFKVEELSPWCIIGFDVLDRTPPQRIAMLKEMGFTKYGYNRGKGDISTMKEEFSLAKQNNIEITSIFLWLNAKRDSIGKLSDANQKLLNNLKEAPFKPTIWISFSDNFFKDRDQKEAVDFCVAMIRNIKNIADDLGCAIALYNHHGWFGNPHNQLEILTQLNDQSISMVYNFHHSQEFVSEFSEILPKIKPFLSYVNISGVATDGPKILTIGEGEYELEMIKLLKKEGYAGPWGILGHIKTEDVEKVLQRNLEGLNALNSKLN